MLDFTLDENVLMLEILELSPTRLSYLQSQQQNSYDSLGSSFLDRVRVILDEYTVLDENDASSSATTKTGLKRADVLEWFSPNESTNQVSADRLYRIKIKLSNLLGIPSKNGYGYQGTPIYKG